MITKPTTGIQVDFMAQAYDLLIIGGGINGTAIAADAAGRGLSVILCEQNDLASGTSSASTKLIHGGLRYLEHYEFRLVRQALKEREILLRKAPHLIQPLQFVLPYQSQMRPIWLIQLGLWLYDHLGGRVSLEKSQRINLKQHEAGKPLFNHFQKGFIYSDCQVDDARLVVLNAMAAKNHNAKILTRTQVSHAKRLHDVWEVTLTDTISKSSFQAKAKVLINATGPWLEDVLKNKIKVTTKTHLSLVKGSHIVVPKLYQGNFAYILQNQDQRVIFIIPYQQKYHLIGTTDVSYEGDLQNVSIEADEIEYLCKAVNQYFKQAITSNHIVWHYSGIRALKKEKIDNPSAITRDYELELNQENNLAPLLSVFGGKITTHRKLAEHALDKLQHLFMHCKPSQTALTPLPGGNIHNADFVGFYQQLQRDYSWLPSDLIYRYAHAYGALTYTLLKDAHSLTHLGKKLSKNLYEREIEYLCDYEWACSAADILWRRTKLGLNFNYEHINQLENIVKNRLKTSNLRTSL